MNPHNNQQPHQKHPMDTPNQQITQQALAALAAQATQAKTTKHAKKQARETWRQESAKYVTTMKTIYKIATELHKLGTPINTIYTQGKLDGIVQLRQLYDTIKKMKENPNHTPYKRETRYKKHGNN